MTIVNRKVGEKIRTYRMKKGITQEEAAFRSKLDYSYFNQIEKGRRNPSIQAISRIAKALGVSIKELFD
jgi:transcriptional regulator with XRE-family HTH domain